MSFKNIKFNFAKYIFILFAILISFECTAGGYVDVVASCQASAMVLQSRTKIKGALSTMKEVEESAEIKGIKAAGNKNAYYGRVVYYFDVYLSEINSAAGNKSVWDLFNSCRESNLLK